jgi:hypothetical protein
LFSGCTGRVHVVLTSHRNRVEIKLHAPEKGDTGIWMEVSEAKGGIDSGERVVFTEVRGGIDRGERCDRQKREVG